MRKKKINTFKETKHILREFCKRLKSARIFSKNCFTLIMCEINTNVQTVLGYDVLKCAMLKFV